MKTNTGSEMAEAFSREYSQFYDPPTQGNQSRSHDISNSASKINLNSHDSHNCWLCVYVFLSGLISCCTESRCFVSQYLIIDTVVLIQIQGFPLVTEKKS